MAQRRNHYERAFERYLRANRIPYIAVNEAKKALVATPAGSCAQSLGALKSFDFVVYRRSRNVLLDVKGRRVKAGAGRLDPWVTEDDIKSLDAWGRLFGSAFVPAFVFCAWCDTCPAGALFQEIFEFEHRWYALRAITLAAYRDAMRPRSSRWGTVCVPARRFEDASVPFGALASSAWPLVSGNSTRLAHGQDSVARHPAAALAPGPGPEYRRPS